ncbi:NUDIX hydrolase [Roseibium salinum]|uniref:NUDIX hydrolase n=1 Tax=Roseibium salinum TaxID=1604349 RepID=A0ABT3R151_9HYPH|nr:NUDIX hydrolase [Roseibium sp. DSM 29163]MCX2722967.1 NUDIX hydrolase [Roseibium sp. DSM 29163]MDN3719098.1 NUDIX hydrolase [Roseibium salinum]
MALSNLQPHDRASWWQSITLLFRRPARLQVAALCHRERNGKREVLLITTKTTHRWILPKGWPDLSMEAHRTAAIEAFEEAGVVGKAHEEPFASFSSHKGGRAGFRIRTEVLVFLVDVESTTEDYRDRGERDVRWVPIDEAIRLADDPGLVDVLRKLDRLAG